MGASQHIRAGKVSDTPLFAASFGTRRAGFNKVSQLWYTTGSRGST
ncbi:hypothetical protein F441_17596 [Phytophthora nicotianae CJ01A1]|uniref:Uncharacterized protein n=4 Tax=Phytophthora nicotianae TaxID=4792 RepID=V9EAU7_PHYNI|nr:hypothetical protein F443_17715 [Phytophthora nicotianae P1569]ETK76323.1 hypothetical protein L915_17252 [Phytophthora nicotianae]ETP05910.1 hypothetical protein F441_17596 [Phytophthora nicotianae CJ01A1]ETP34031.1 hypothetical protein F442_17573 [Phytophthora nicotianae P10297]ETL29765.1 hypothetical protein L916_17144 [Phytophthora nicotianae]